MHAHSSWYISCLCIISICLWLYYYCHDEPLMVTSHTGAATTQCSVTAYRDLPKSVQRNICHYATHAGQLFNADPCQYRLAIMRTFLSGGYQHRT